jgi:hypothetical protein
MEGNLVITEIAPSTSVGTASATMRVLSVEPNPYSAVMGGIEGLFQARPLATDRSILSTSIDAT